MLTTIGEVLVDFTPLAPDGGAIRFQARPGGSPANVAVGLARLGAQVEFAGKISTDFFGRLLLRYLAGEGIGTRFVSRSPAPSILAFVAADHAGPSFTFYGGETAGADIGSGDLPDSIDQSRILHFGSISLLAASTSDTVLALADRVRGRCLLSLDPNIRPNLIRDAGGYRRTLDRALRTADVVKVSTEDLKWLAPETAFDAAAERLLAFGPALVIVTLGADGCYARTPAHELRVAAPRVAVADTVGAGDAFSSGLLARLTDAGLSSRRALEQAGTTDIAEALRYATGTATLTCTRPGADPPRRQELEEFLRTPRFGAG